MGSLRLFYLLGFGVLLFAILASSTNATDVALNREKRSYWDDYHDYPHRHHHRHYHGGWWRRHRRRHHHHGHHGRHGW
ncbi:hypothetical protein RvY_06782-2 [Ramazzottius varieornatus]|uniref:Uncharacterized protein n=1 Tax=Ramazzottius varieornatus TaxID=947166 RepID=A0A1D1V9B4_RAMVA|nr:hypothetical protein RvY_06782-2 [Ramazzottius varieornatus]